MSKRATFVKQNTIVNRRFKDLKFRLRYEGEGREIELASDDEDGGPQLLEQSATNSLLYGVEENSLDAEANPEKEGESEGSEDRRKRKAVMAAAFRSSLKRDIGLKMQLELKKDDLREILQKESKVRKEDENDRLVQILMNIQFFKD